MKVFNKQDLIDFAPKHHTLVAIDSDGCMFDTMEEKQLRHFAPNVVKHFQLESVEEAAFDCVKFVWLYPEHADLTALQIYSDSSSV